MSKQEERSMKQKTIHTNHLRRVRVRKLRAAILAGAFLSFLFAASLLPWLGATAPWAIHWIGGALSWGPRPGAFPNPLDFISAPNLILGLIWLVYYTIAYIRAKTTFSSRQLSQLMWEYNHRDDDQNTEYTSLFHSPPLERPRKQPPLSHAWPGEQKHELVEHCYRMYRKALQRYNPPPVELHTPPNFYYRAGNTFSSNPLGWFWNTMEPIIPEIFLTPEGLPLLLPLLAHHLAWYNTEVPRLEALHRYPDYVPWRWLLTPTGNFLWLPVALKHAMEGADRLQVTAQQIAQVHNADEFAVLLGQGPALEHLLRRMCAELEQQGQMDLGTPTLSERLGHLEVLNKQEREKMRKLGLSPKEPPLVKGDLPRQLRPGSGRKRPG
jgi:hypothetical protein